MGELMTYQLHYQVIKEPEKTDFLAQFHAASTGEYRRKITQLLEEYAPPPEGKHFIVYMESSKYFVPDKGDYDEVDEN